MRRQSAAQPVWLKGTRAARNKLAAPHCGRRDWRCAGIRVRQDPGGKPSSRSLHSRAGVSQPRRQLSIERWREPLVITLDDDKPPLPSAARVSGLWAATQPGRRQHQWAKPIQIWAPGQGSGGGLKPLPEDREIEWAASPPHLVACPPSPNPGGPLSKLLNQLPHAGNAVAPNTPWLAHRYTNKPRRKAGHGRSTVTKGRPSSFRRAQAGDRRITVSQGVASALQPWRQQPQTRNP